jgi:Ras-related protein Rab-5C
MPSGSAVRSEKIVLIGAASCGKTALVTRFAHDRFSGEMDSTIGAAFVAKTFNIDGVELKFQIWDTGGTEKYKALTPMYFREARAAIVVFDVTCEQSFNEASDWLSDFRQKGESGAIVIGAANKVDLVAERKIASELVQEFGYRNQLDFITETSALTGEGVMELFTELGRRLLALPAPNRGELLLSDMPVQSDKNQCC